MPRLSQRRLAGFVCFLSILLAFTAAINFLQLKPIRKVRAQGHSYYVATNGSDSNSGTSSQPWKTIGYALKQLYAGDTLYIRGASYADVPANGWSLNRSGTAAQPITITNYQSEQVIIKVNQAGSWVGEYSPFSCQGVDYVRLVGTDVSPRTLSSGLVSSKGIVIQGPDSGWTDAEGIRAWDCAYWEVSGIDFVRMGCGLFGHGFGSEHWQIHHNRVYSFCRETGMQLNGPYNTIEGNELYKVSNDDCVSYGGPSHLALLGYGNIVRNNIMDGAGSTSGDMWGILLEWDIADDNLIEGNIFKNTKNGINFAGGDNNLIRNNIFIKGSYSGNSNTAGLYIQSYDGRSDWPCNEWYTPSSEPGYSYWQNPSNCHSRNNQIYNNVIVGYKWGVIFGDRIPEGNTIIRNNVFINLQTGTICDGSKCGSLSGVTQSNNRDISPYGFVNQNNEDFHLTPSSPLIDAGYNLGSLVPNDFDGNPRPQGGGYDIGAYEYGGAQPISTPTPTPRPTSTPTPTATPTPKPSFNLNSGWNQVSWISGLPSYTSKSSLEDINQDCGTSTGQVLSRKNQDFWEEYLVGYGGLNFNLQTNQIYFLKVSKSCQWQP